MPEVSQPFPRAEVAEMFAEIADLPIAAVVWDLEPLPFLGQMGGGPGWWVQLSMKSIRAKGIDDQRYVYDPVRQVNTLLQVGYRLATVEVRVTSNSTQVPAFDTMEKIRRRLRSLTSKTAMQEIDIAMVDFDKSVDLPKDKDNRTASESVMTVTFSWLVTEDPGDDTGNWIETAVPVGGNLTP